jgi:hypothetical protein
MSQQRREMWRLSLYTIGSGWVDSTVEFTSEAAALSRVQTLRDWGVNTLIRLEHVEQHVIENIKSRKEV